jgi:hypothetical protein
LRPFGTARANLRQLRTARSLHAVVIRVHWDLLHFDAHGAAAAEFFAASLRALRNLPPPNAVRLVGGEGAGQSIEVAPDAVQALTAVMRQWQEVYTPWNLTFARGPGFIRIFDKRDDSSGGTFIILKAFQVAVFDACARGSGLDDIAAAVPAVPLEMLEGLIQSLLDRGIVCCLGGDYLAMPIRRSQQERWTTGLG